MAIRQYLKEDEKSILCACRCIADAVNSTIKDRCIDFDAIPQLGIDFFGFYKKHYMDYIEPPTGSVLNPTPHREYKEPSEYGLQIVAPEVFSELMNDFRILSIGNPSFFAVNDLVRKAWYEYFELLEPRNIFAGPSGKLYIGFEPFVNHDSSILILGGRAEGKKRREEKFYYDNPANRFWSVIAESFGDKVPQSLQEKKELLTRRKIALWNIKTYQRAVHARYHESMWFFSQNELWFPSNCYVKIKFSANIPKLLDCYPIKKIITNGRNEYESLVTDYKWDLEDRGMFENCTFLPSTTPASNRLDKNIWIDALRNL